MLGYRESLVRDWPGPARPDDADATFPDGWRRTAVAAIEAGAVQTALVDALDADDRAAFERVTADRRQLAAHLREREQVEGCPPARAPAAVGASDLITYVQCPKRFYWSRVRPLPRFSGPAARIGTEIHAWIERRARGQGRLLELEDRPDLTDEELAGDPGRVERLRESFLASRSRACRRSTRSGRSCCASGEFTVGGRIDAIFGEPTGPGRSSTGRRAAAPPPTTPPSACSSTCTGSPRSRSGEAPRRSHAHVPLPRERRRGHEADGRPGGRAGTCGGLAHRDRRRRVRPDARPVVHALRLPLVLRRRPGVARPVESEHQLGYSTLASRSIESSNRR